MENDLVLVKDLILAVLAAMWFVFFVGGIVHAGVRSDIKRLEREVEKLKREANVLRSMLWDVNE